MITGSKVIEFEGALEKGFELLESGENRTLGLLIVCGVNFGLRISDLLGITYDQLKSGKFVVNEKKTKKARVMVVNDNIKRALTYMEGDITYQLGGSAFKSQKGTVYSPQHVNRMLKKVFGGGYSSHGLRKGFGRRVYEKKDKDLALVMLQLQHANPSDTLKYIGVTQENVEQTYLDII